MKNRGLVILDASVLNPMAQISVITGTNLLNTLKLDGYDLKYPLIFMRDRTPRKRWRFGVGVLGIAR